MLLAPQCQFVLPNSCQCPNPCMLIDAYEPGDTEYKKFCLLHEKLINASNVPTEAQANEQIQGDRSVDKQ